MQYFILGCGHGNRFLFNLESPLPQGQGVFPVQSTENFGDGFFAGDFEIWFFLRPPHGWDPALGWASGRGLEKKPAQEHIHPLHLCAQGTSVSRGIFTYTLLFSYSFLRRLPGNRQQSVACFQCIPVSGAGDSRFLVPDLF